MHEISGNMDSMDQSRPGVTVFFRNGDRMQFPRATNVVISSDKERIDIYGEETSFIASFFKDDVRGYTPRIVEFTEIKAA
jgi:hypothetical protein